MIGPGAVMLALGIALCLFAVGYHYWAARKVSSYWIGVQATLDETLKDATKGHRILMQLALAHPPGECKAEECLLCGVIVCPENEPLHFHHDGCPACETRVDPDLGIST